MLIQNKRHTIFLIVCEVNDESSGSERAFVFMLDGTQKIRLSLQPTVYNVQCFSIVEAIKRMSDYNS